MFDMQEYCVFVEDFYKLMIWWKVFTNSFNEYSPDIGFNRFAVWWIEPNNVTFSFLFVMIFILLVVHIVA